MKSAVGIVGMSIADFYNSEPREIHLILEGFRTRKEDEFKLNQIAVSNAIGAMFKKGFKLQNPFKDEPAASPKAKQSSIEEKENTLNYLFNKFEKKEVDINK